VSTRYTVELIDGRSFGPADAATLRTWATEGRIPPVANIRGSDGSTVRAIDCEPIRDVMNRVASAPPMGAGALPSPQDNSASVIIPYKNVSALVGYYTSIGSLIPIVGLIAGPVAIWLGVKGLKAVKADPRVHGTAHSWVAIILGSLTSLAYWGIALMVVIGAVVR
jgi:hypothetical protein